jgi:hypothetical protein
MNDENKNKEKPEEITATDLAQRIGQENSVSAHWSTAEAMFEDIIRANAEKKKKIEEERKRRNIALTRSQRLRKD